MPPSLIDFSPTRGVLIERPATAADFVDGFPRSIVEYDPHLGLIQQYVSVAEAEDMDLLDDATAEMLRAQQDEARAMRGAA